MTLNPDSLVLGILIEKQAQIVERDQIIAELAADNKSLREQLETGHQAQEDSPSSAHTSEQ